MSGDFRADPATLEGVAGKLRRASSALEGGASAPPAPEAGACSAAVNAVLSLLSESVAGVVEGVGAAGDTVAKSRDVYVDTDRSQAGSLASTYPDN